MVALSPPLDRPVNGVVARVSLRRIVACGRVGQGAVMVALVALAFGLRLPYLWSVPAFTDEWEEIEVSRRILAGQALPLINVNAILGALPSYLLAGWFWMFGETVYAPRLFVAVLGALQVLPTYLLAGEMLLAIRPGRTVVATVAALAAATLLATSGAHIVLNGHVAWAISTTPLFTTAALWLMVRAHRRSRERGAGGPELAAAGLCWGLALQTHISVLVLIAGAAVGGALTLRPLLSTRWTILAAALFLLGCANLIVYNLLAGMETFALATAKSVEYDGASSTPYLERLADLGLSLFRLLGGALEDRGSRIAFLTDPALIGLACLVIVALLVLAERGQPLALAVCAAVVLLMPVVNSRYTPLLSGRYLTPLLPVCYAGVGVLLALLARRAFRAGGPRSAAIVALAPVLVVGGYSLGQLGALYERMENTGRTNVVIWRTMDAIRAHRGPSEEVILDARLARVQIIKAGNGNVRATLEALLEMERVPYRVVELNGRWRPSRPALLVMAARDSPGSAAEVVRALPLRAPDGGPPPPAPDSRRAKPLEIYRVSGP